MLQPTSKTKGTFQRLRKHICAANQTTDSLGLGWEMWNMQQKRP